MIILAIETSTAQGGVALLDGERVLSSRQWMRAQSHSELLTAAIDDVLNEAKLSMQSIGALAVGVGPGSFTGIRVAISAVKSLAFARNLSVFCFDSTEIIAAGRPQKDRPIIVALDAQKNQLFHSEFEASKELLPKRTSALELIDAAALKVDESKSILLGDGIEARPKTEFDFPRAEILGKLAWTYRASRSPLVWKDVQPLYLRTSGAEEKLRGSNG
ncbi:MAG TPA: tRNA (adenosine(37)-N6)-threonylcarbamoyltransferase complex dimerization subunit type 1 TsaB [Bdellovibrionales bacterium]|jgi:tRNA threonylcarbamoyl adenosine modification protein YeaZ|nr:tRNA (adenosine(37)-N6)-threonylcarbamoyltransferase complex dimerization subunit type 1 TsaB [Bdellovibrionales bacterium]